MGNLKSTQVIILLLLYLGTLLISLACPDCPYPIPSSKSPNLPRKYPYDKPPLLQPPRLPRRPFVHPPPVRPELPIFATLPITPKPPIVFPPIIPTPPITPPPLSPVLPQSPPETPSLPPPPQETPCPPPPETCPKLKLDECIDKIGSLVHIGIGSKAKDTCCPVLAGLLDLDAALCLCTNIKAKLFNINDGIPIALQVLVDCGKTLPSGFQCPT